MTGVQTCALPISSGGEGHAAHDVVKVASALPGTAGWAATGAHYAKKAYDYVKAKKMNEDKDPCWKGFKAYGMKKKNGKKVPNCVPVKETGPVMSRYTERPTYEGRERPADYSDAAERGIYEVSPQTLGSYIKKASASRKKSLEGTKADIKTWGKRQKGITTAIKKLTKEAGSQDKDWDEVNSGQFGVCEDNINKPDLPLQGASYTGAGGTQRTVHEDKKKKVVVKLNPNKEIGYTVHDVGPGRKLTLIKQGTYKAGETKMQEQNDLINEAIVNIAEENLSEMKENFLTVLQEKVIGKLEERKKQIASDYFAQ